MSSKAATGPYTFGSIKKIIEQSLGPTVIFKAKLATHTIRVAIEEFELKTVKFKTELYPVYKLLSFANNGHWVQIVAACEKSQRRKDASFLFSSCAVLETKLRFCIVPIPQALKAQAKKKQSLEEFDLKHPAKKTKSVSTE